MSNTETDCTIEYYNEQAKAFIDRTIERDLTSEYERFLSHIPIGGRILDVGCGSGRDLKYFADHGYDACGMDASIAMVEHARNYSRRTVMHLRFDELTYDAEFDGIWACASLLHVPGDALPSILDILAKALRTGGVLYMSFKEGEHEGLKEGRFFTFWTSDRLRSMIEAHSGLTMIELWRVEPYTEHAVRWVSCTVRSTLAD